MFKQLNEKLIATQKLTIKETLAYGLGHLAIGLGGMGSANYLQFYWTDIALIPLAAVSLIMLLSRVFDGVNDIFIAWLVDRTDTKLGKARPWILACCIPATIVNIALFTSPNFSVTGRVIWAAVTYNLVNLIFSTCCMIPIFSMTSLITPEPKGRITLNLSGQIATVISQIVVSMTFVWCTSQFSDEKSGYFWFFAACAVVAGVAMFLNFAGTRENVKPIKTQARKLSFGQAMKSILSNKWWLLAIGSQFFLFMLMTTMSVNIYFATYIAQDLNVLTTLMGITYAAQFFVPFAMLPLMNKLGKSVSTNIALLLGLIGYLLPLLNLTSIPLLLAAAVLKGIGMSGMSCTRFAVLADVVDYGEWKNGDRSDALIFSGSSITAKLGMGIASMLITVILGAGGYVGGAATQTPGALGTITFLFTWFNVILVVLTMACILALNKLEKQMPTIQRELAQRKAAAEA